MKQKHVVFDFDGTIADSLQVTTEGLNRLASEYGFAKIDISLFDEGKRRGIEAAGIPLERAEEIIMRNLEEIAPYFDRVGPYEGLVAVLREMKKKQWRLGMLTSNLKKNVDTFIQTNRLKGMFDFVQVSGGLFNKAEFLLEMIKKAGLAEGDLVYVGDETRDVKAAKKAGVVSVAVSWGFDARALLKANRPDYLVDKPEELIGVVDEIFS